MNAPIPWRQVPRILGRWLLLARSQWWPEERIGRYADARLRALVRHAAAHVPYYRALFRDIGLDPAAFRGRADLGRIPPLDKETVRRRRDELVADNAAAFHPEEHRTSGSTGTPLRFLVDDESVRHDAAAMLRAYAWAGYWPYWTKAFWSRWHTESWKLRRRLAGRCLGYNPIHLEEGNVDDVWREINRLRPAVFNGYPYTLYLLARLARDQGIPHHRPRALICVGETLTRELRQALLEVYGGPRIFDYYGLSERVAHIATCPHGTLHAMDDCAFHEVVTSEGAPVTEGVGEILGTAYFNFAMPLIRYRTRDLARVAPARTCVCGRRHRVIEALEGRRDDHIETPEGKVITLITIPQEEGRGIAASQLIQDARDHLWINILPAPDYDPTSLADIERRMRDRVGPSMRIEFRTVSALERRPGDRGKIPSVISRITPTLMGRSNLES